MQAVCLESADQLNADRFSKNKQLHEIIVTWDLREKRKGPAHYLLDLRFSQTKIALSLLSHVLLLTCLGITRKADVQC